MSKSTTSNPMTEENKDELIVKMKQEIELQEALIKRHCDEWADDHTHLQNLCRKHGFSEARVEGDERGIPTISDLADLLDKKIDELKKRDDAMHETLT